MRFPTLPDTTKLVTVVVTLGKTIEWAAVPVSLNSVNVLVPVIVFVAVLAPRAHQILAKVEPPAKVLPVLLESVIFIVELPGVSVRLVAVAVVQTVLVP